MVANIKEREGTASAWQGFSGGLWQKDINVRDFIQQIRRRPQVMDVYFLAGTDDFILHVTARDTEDLRSFVVDNLNADDDVAGTQTSLIFEHLRGAAPV